MRKQVLLLLVLVALLGATAACGGDDDEAAPEPAAPTTEADTGATTEEPDPCATDQLATVVDGALTIGTDNPAFPPWFQDAEGAPWDPTGEPTGEGYEAAVAYAVAEELGFPEDAVDWVVVPFNKSSGPGPRTSTSTSTRSPTGRSATRRSTSATPTTTSSRRSSR